MQAVIDTYFARCNAGQIITVIRKGEPIEINQRIPKTVAGLALALGFSSRQTLLNYQDIPETMDVITRAKLEIERDNLEGGMMNQYESRLTSLNLTSNYGYSTRSSVEVNFDEQLQAIIKALPEKYAIQVQAALVSLAGKKQVEGPK